MLVRFLGFELDVERCELRQGGKAVSLQPRALDALVFLVRHRERVVTYSMLHQGPWQGVTVSDAAVHQIIRRLRTVLGDDPNHQHAIQTVRGKGFRFVAEVEAVTPQSLIVVGDREASKSGGSSTLRVESASSRLFVGRGDELKRLAEALQRARQGQGSAILLHGCPGIGKTRLLERFAELAVPSDAITHTTLVWGRCWEADGRPSLWPWPEVVRGAAEHLVARAGLTALEVAAEDFEAELMQLVPELRRWLSDGDTPEPPQVPEERFSAFRMLDVISRFLLRVAERCGHIPQADEFDDDPAPSVVDPGAALVLVLEDLHLADPDALQLVEVLCKAISSAPLLLVASYRSLEGWELSVLQAARESALPNAQSWQLEGLTAGDIQCWARACLPHAPPTIGETLHRTAEGHPLMTADLIHKLLQQGEASPTDPVQTQEILERTVSPLRQIPERIAESFRRRLATLPSPELDLLQTASVFGDEALLFLLAQVTRRELVDVLRLLRRPMRQGLVRQGNDSILRFSHKLVREVLYRDLDPGHRFSLHAAIGRSMAEHLEIHPSWLMQVAYHYLHAGPDGQAQQRRRLRHAPDRMARNITAWRRNDLIVMAQGEAPTTATEHEEMMGVFQAGFAENSNRIRVVVIADAGPNATQRESLVQTAWSEGQSRGAIITDRRLVRAIVTSLGSFGVNLRASSPEKHEQCLRDFLGLNQEELVSVRTAARSLRGKLTCPTPSLDRFLALTA